MAVSDMLAFIYEERSTEEVFVPLFPLSKVSFLTRIFKLPHIVLIFKHAIASILVTTMCFKIAELGELAHVALGGSGGKTKLGDDVVRSDFLFVGHKD